MRTIAAIVLTAVATAAAMKVVEPRSADAAPGDSVVYDTVFAKHFVMTDDDGSLRGTWDVYEGDAALVIFDDVGNVKALLDESAGLYVGPGGLPNSTFVSPGRPGIVCRDARGRVKFKK